MYHLKLFVLPLGASLFGFSSGANVPDSFNLYAYGEGIGGYPIVYLNGIAYVGQQSQLNASTPVARFTLSSNTLVANSNNTADTDGFLNATFFVPGPDNSSPQAGFVNGTPPATAVSTGWTFYGQTLLLVGSSGQWDGLFSAEPTEQDGIFSLNWNQTSDTAVQLSLRLTSPSSTV
ncbi:uncharacterized protein TRIVIDRAFT_68991 [Trichoderma virens Gv29-8]|uniref:Uncharacterized protein n=1 Tax=Hypocrea virens (strain Gv29-8 / FGSC 10586) TaxID=413071 RepID=G9MYP1_HYPVG|nr:uncharacterized protein TRIVIDRAFT_68991 [Trichoderma virens Gv29-8]EHK20455.1 hypothetical protein TRIVIDRAFT_68991 [Trichoderma virens Gv29-8]UKZ52918.1 hypothetical protein TrVGV298_006704 [Trichoderma virens]